jgi:hypothetical protein
MVQDLSEIHQPLGKLGELPKSAKEWERFELTGRFFPVLFDPQAAGCDPTLFAQPVYQ